MTHPDLGILGLGAAQVEAIGGGDTCRAWRVTRGDGSRVFVKQMPSGATEMAELEAAGLRWLGAEGMRVPEVVAVEGTLLALSWVDGGSPTKAAAAALGADLAALHSRPASFFGCPPPGQPAARSGWVGAVRVPFSPPPEPPPTSLPEEGTGAPRDSPAVTRPSGSEPWQTEPWGTERGYGSWAEFYVDRRLVPTAAEAHRVGGLTDSMRRRIDDLCDALLTDSDAVGGPPVEPAPIHGDLWAGNVMWQVDAPTLIDPSAVGGHPETDLAMLHLFGLPHVETVVEAYQLVRPLPSDWRDRIPLHQVFPLLVHAVMFGSGYGAQAAAAASSALRSAR